jgi:hypothetical protein
MPTNTNQQCPNKKQDAARSLPFRTSRHLGRVGSGPIVHLRFRGARRIHVSQNCTDTKPFLRGLAVPREPKFQHLRDRRPSRAKQAALLFDKSAKSPNKSPIFGRPRALARTTPSQTAASRRCHRPQASSVACWVTDKT